MDSHFTVDSQQCYEISYSNACYNLHFSNHCEDCRDGYLLEDCTGCSNCFACSHLNNLSYHVFNTAVAKEEYEDIVQRFLSGDYEIREKIAEFFAHVPYNQRYITRGQDCLGHNIKDSKRCISSFNIQDGEDLKYCNVTLGGIVDCYDIDQTGLNANLLYEFMTGSMDLYRVMFSFVIRENSQYLMYCDDMSNCSNCFGCVGLTNKSYCILNKQYTESEYFALIPKIIDHMTMAGEW